MGEVSEGQGRKPRVAREPGAVDLWAGVVGLLFGLALGPVADRLATNAPLHQPLLRRTQLSPRVPLVTAATALLGAACGLAFGLGFEGLISALFCFVLVIVTRTDFEHRLIPNSIVLPGTGLVLVARTVDDPSAGWVIAALGAGLVLFLTVFVYPRGLGMGDVKLAAFLGAGLGAAVVSALFIGFVAAFVPALYLLLRRGKTALKETVPFGPFLAFGGVVALFAGGAILDWYTKLGS